jgi:hypothetical protein
MKNKWENYALKDGKVRESYIKEYSSRSPKRQAREASGRDRILESREEQPKAEEEIEQLERLPLPLCLQEIVEEKVKWYQNMTGVSTEEKHKESSDSEGQTRSFTPGHQTVENERITNSLRGKDESIREKDVGETHQQGRQGIQGSDQRRCEAEEGSPKVKTRKRKPKREET